MPLSSSPLRTLVIDDDEMSRDLLTVLLEAEDHLVESAPSGEAALAQLHHSQPIYDLILADIQLPGISGSELATQLRHTCGPRPLLLAISGSQPSTTELALYDGFLLKPFRVDAIAAALQKRVVQNPSHQSGTSSATPDVFSIAASAQPDASNQCMTLPLQQQEFSPAPLQAVKFTASTSLHDIPVLNEQIYLQLAASMPLSQLHDMYQLCIDDARKRIASMRTLAQQNDGTQFTREAHAIKGGSGMLGATQLHRLAAALEACGLSSDQEDVNSLDELGAACDRLERMLRSRV